MTFDAIRAKVNEMVKDYLGCSDEAIKSEAYLMDDLGADTLDVVELVMGLEDEFGITILDEESNNVKSLDDLYRIVASKCGIEIDLK